jgi:hypothetical protein
MTDSNDKPDQAAAARAPCTETGMREVLDNLQEFALMMCRRSSIRALEILEVVAPDRDTPPEPRAHARPADVIPHPAARKPDE